MRHSIAVLMLLLLVPFVYAQERSVKPGINDSFRDPNVEFYTNLFEGEDRAIFAHRVEILNAIALESGQNVADIGAGTGFFSLMFAEKVAPNGDVYAVDIAENFVQHIKSNAKERSIKNLKPVLCTDRDTKLKSNSVDVVFICDTYHHFEYPVDTMASIHNAMRPGGKLMIVDFERIKGVHTDWTLNHVRCGKGTVTDEIKDAGFDFVEEIPIMDDQYVIVFRKRVVVLDGK